MIEVVCNLRNVDICKDTKKHKEVSGNQKHADLLFIINTCSIGKV